MALRAFAQRWGLLHHREEPLEDEDPLWRAPLHKDADHEIGGLSCNDDKLLAEMREAIMAWVKSMGRQILAGNLNLVNTSFPVLMFEPRSYLQKLADPWVYPEYINAAAAATDPLERMKLLLTWVVAGMWKGFDTWKKPFNPILGETWQAELEGGVTLFMEQVSHHPPVSAYQLVGPNGSWRFSGWSQPAVAPVVKFYGIKTLAKGRRRLELPDGTVIELFMPHYAIKGVVYAARPRAEVLGVLRIVDAANGLEAVASFGPVKGARHRVLTRADAVCGEIYRLPGGAAAAAARDASSSSAAAAAPAGALQRTLTEAQALDSIGGDGADDPDALLPSGSDGGGGPDEEDAAIFDAVTAAGGLSGGARLDEDPAAAVLAARRSSGTGAPGPGPSGAGGDGAAAAAAPAGHSPPPAPASGGGGGGGRASTAGGRGLRASSSSGARASGSGLLARVRPRRSIGSGDLGVGPDGSHAAAAAGDVAGADGAEASYHRNHGVCVPGIAVARIEGSWLSHLNIDSTRYWTLAESRPSLWGPPSAGAPLPSDAGARRDLRALQEGDRERSQKVKEEMEVEQRTDRKLREAAGVFEHH
ncbi:hypothetical protein Rsub_04498 [Raphidocelis subcapitata]|uniref:Oxysterol-binding protein n=1 Tax=Raphidocelis subcapitata TaxID=307507 RepID=A0A2V0NWZ6_9CHLO|nr:hypothetical protein Rsub_04498 [Raphidocelis subcapitata]|eukprot:GBF92151.1 hypothetical protein Rsub_04498 [Raphidocelis subcapitata]